MRRKKNSLAVVESWIDLYDLQVLATASTATWAVIGTRSAERLRGLPDHTFGPFWTRRVWPGTSCTPAVTAPFVLQPPPSTEANQHRYFALPALL